MDVDGTDTPMTRWTTTYGLTSRLFCVTQAQSATAPSQAMYFDKICISTKLGQAIGIEYISYNLMRSGSEP